MNETRFRTTTQKIPREVTGLNGAIFVHIDFDKAGQAVSLRINHKWKDESSLDNILSALSDTVTDILTETAHD